MSGFEIKIVDKQKGKGLYATKPFNKGDIIFEEKPLISCQFAWNAAYRYLACDHCMRPLENAEQNVRRLSGRPDLVLPYPSCCSSTLDTISCCPRCDIKYCSLQCCEAAYNSYHKTICHDTTNPSHPLVKLVDTWKQIHYPPETTSIMLIVRMLAMIKQSEQPELVSQQFKQFCHRTVNDDEVLIHKLLGAEFQNQINMLREMISHSISGDHIQEFLTPEMFNALMALIGTNGQGIGTSPIAQWCNNVADLKLSSEERKSVDELIDKFYELMDAESGTFLNNEGSGLYELQSACNHSCDPNAESTFPHSNFCLQLKAIKPINPGDEILISYLDECALGRSRHSRQKELEENYLFRCSCTKCIEQINDPDVTSAEEMSEDDEDMEDMYD